MKNLSELPILYETLDNKDEYLIKKMATIQLYKDIFAEPLYEESFRDEVAELFASYVVSGILLYLENENGPLGFAAAIPLTLEQEIANLANTYGIKPESPWYFSDLGVKKNTRRSGLGITLVQALTGRVPAQKLLMRTSEANIASQKLNQKIGFKVVEGMEQFVEQTRQNGEIRKDRRIFLLYDKTAKQNTD